MNKHVSDFLDIILSQIRYKKIHGVISAELKSHIDDLSEKYISEGLSEDEAMKKAIAQMGDPYEIGKKLHKTHKPRTEWSIFVLVGVLITFGLYIMLSYAVTYWNLNLFYRQAAFAAIGILLLLFCYFFDYTRLEKYSSHAYIAIVMLMFLSLFSNATIHGRIQIAIFGFSFTASTAAIPFLLITYAGMVKKWCDGSMENMLKLMALSSLPIISCILEPMLINAMIIGAGFLTMVTFAICDDKFCGNRKKLLLSIYGGIAGLLLLFVIWVLGPNIYRLNRFTIFLNPESDPTGAGYTNMLLTRLLSSAKFVGDSGSLINNKGETVIVLPGANSEFIFTYVVATFGWLFGIILATLLILVIARLFIATSKINQRHGKYLSIGICCVFSLQIIVNILMNLGYFPLFGISLPFISYGGASFICNMTLIGMLLGIYRRKDITLPETI